MDQDLKIERLVTYRYFGFQTTDLAEILRKAKDHECDPFHDLENYKDRVDTAVNACFLGSLALYESTYLLYGYKFRKKEYGFAWETYYDGADGYYILVSASAGTSCSSGALICCRFTSD